jgi:hypothetical protein
MSCSSFWPLFSFSKKPTRVRSGDAPAHITHAPLSRAQRAHTRLSWDQRLVRNARAQSLVKPTITLFGVPDMFAALLGLRAF